MYQAAVLLPQKRTSHRERRDVSHMPFAHDHQEDVANDAGRAGHLPLVRTPLQVPYTAMYGSDIVTARYCGFLTPPSPPLGLWMHGWYPERRPLDRPERLFEVTMAHLRDERYWVTTERQAIFLRSQGFSRSRAIGLPIVYVPRPQIEREKGTLLVMPAHSLPASRDAWADSDYVNSIRALVPVFRKICVCVNSHDWTKGQWLHDFRAAGFEVIRGAGDNSSLERMASLFARFESVTTNGFGSLLAYASAFGAKVSIHGQFAEVTPDSLKNVPYWVDHPEFLASDTAFWGERSCRDMFPEFFTHPADAAERIEWGRTEIGWHNKVSPDELRQLFGWSKLGLAKSRISDAVTRARDAVPQSVRTPVKTMLAPNLRKDRRERRRLESMDAETPGETPLFGRAFRYVDARSYLQAYDDCFVKHLYRFRGTSERPFIVDGHADIGLGVLYFKCLYPQSRVLAFETRPAAFEILEHNCRTYGLEDVERVQDDLWGGVPVDGPVGRAHASPVHADVDASRLQPRLLSEHDGGPSPRIDLLKMRVDGSQSGRVRELSPVLGNVENVCVDFHPRFGDPQNLGSLIDVLESAGFRISVQAVGSTWTQPLMRLPGASASDNQQRIMGIRM